MESCIVDEMRFVIILTVSVAITTWSWCRQSWGGYFHVKFAECSAKRRLVRNSAFVSLESQCCVKAGNVLGEQFSANLSRLIPAKSSWIPSCFHDDIRIVSGRDEHVSCSCIANDGSIVEYVEVEIRNLCGVFGWIGEIDTCLEVEGMFSSAQDFEIADFGLEIREATTCRDRYNLVSFGAIELKKVNGALTFHRNDTLCRQIFDYEFAQNCGNLDVNEGNNFKFNGLTEQY
jgi:hypothetical protein